MGRRKVCGTARSGVCNLDHLSVQWRMRGSHDTAWVTPGHDCLCAYAYGHGAAVRPPTSRSIWDGALGLWGKFASLFVSKVRKGEVPSGVNLNWYAGLGSFTPWHCDNEPLFGPQTSPELIVSEVCRRTRGDAPSSTRLDHGDLLVMDGVAQLQFGHRTVSRLPFPRASCPTSRRNLLCSTFVRARFSRAGSSAGGAGEANSAFVLVDGPNVSCGNTLGLNTRSGVAQHPGPQPTQERVSLRGVPLHLGWGKVLAAAATWWSTEKVLFLVPLEKIPRENDVFFFFQIWFYSRNNPLSTTLTYEQPSPCHRDV